jgi:hypothetical protein
VAESNNGRGVLLVAGRDEMGALFTIMHALARKSLAMRKSFVNG